MEQGAGGSRRLQDMWYKQFQRLYYRAKPFFSVRKTTKTEGHIKVPAFQALPVLPDVRWTVRRPGGWQQYIPSIGNIIRKSQLRGGASVQRLQRGRKIFTRMSVGKPIVVPANRLQRMLEPKTEADRSRKASLLTMTRVARAGSISQHTAMMLGGINYFRAQNFRVASKNFSCCNQFPPKAGF